MKAYLVLLHCDEVLMAYAAPQRSLQSYCHVSKQVSKSFCIKAYFFWGKKSLIKIPFELICSEKEYCSVSWLAATLWSCLRFCPAADFFGKAALTAGSHCVSRDRLSPCWTSSWTLGRLNQWNRTSPRGFIVRWPQTGLLELHFLMACTSFRQVGLTKSEFLWVLILPSCFCCHLTYH